MPKAVVFSFYVSCRELSFTHFRFFRFLKMTDICEQRAAINYCFLLGRSAASAVDMLPVARNEHTLKTKFLSCIRALNAMTCRLKTIDARAMSRTDENVEKILVYRRLTIDEISELSGISWSLVQCTITEDLQMTRDAVKFVLCLLIADQKQARVKCHSLFFGALGNRQRFFR